MLILENPVTLEAILDNRLNVAEILDEQDLDKIGQAVIDGYEIDEASRAHWLESNDQWMKLALQVIEKKNTPWMNASNVKYPLITISAIQFAARAYPALIPADGLVRGRVIGEDPNGLKGERVGRVAQYMNYQFLEEMEYWEDEMDKLFVVVPIIGCAFKKTYYDPVADVNRSDLIFPKDLSVNYYAKSLETAPRITHIMERSSNYVYERQAVGVYLDIDLSQPNQMLIHERHAKQNTDGGRPVGYADDTDRVILEQCRFLDLDDDGYQEPYVVTVDQSSGKVLRIVPRFDEERVMVTEAGKVARITPKHYYTKYPFIPNPDGGFYDMGFGNLVGPLNESANTIINQLVDAGTLSNMQSGFISKGIRMRTGDYSFKPGEWKPVNATGQTLRDGIFPLPVREPSGVLFSLLGTLIESGNRTASVTDIMVGESPGQNQPATTTMAVLEQGTMVFTGIHKRLRRALTHEVKKLYELNKENLSEDKYFIVLDSAEETVNQIGRDDFEGDPTDIAVTADPNVVTQAQELVKAKALLEMLPLGINVEEVKVRMLKAQKQPNIEALLRPNPPPAPDPELVLKEQEQKLKYLVETAKLENSATQVDNEALKDAAVGELSLAKAQESLAKAQSLGVTATLQQIQQHLEVLRSALDLGEKERQAVAGATNGETEGEDQT